MPAIDAGLNRVACGLRLQANPRGARLKPDATITRLKPDAPLTWDADD
jgi:hypothetical protein